MNIKTAISKGVSVVTTIGLISLILGSSLLSTPPVNAADVLLVSVAITVSPGTICAGQSSHITWSSTDATSIFIDQGIGSVLPYGARDVSPTQTTTYTITGTNSTGGFGTASATVFVNGSCSTPTPTPTWTPTPTPVWTPTPLPLSLGCAPSVQSAQSGQLITFSASYNYPTFYIGNLTWQAVGGHPSSGTGSSFTTRFNTSSINETRLVTVSDGSQTATCVVYVYGPTPTWTPTPTSLQCNPSSVSGPSGSTFNFWATGGNGSYTWNTDSGSPSYGYGQNFSATIYNWSTSNRDVYVTVTSGNQSSSCRARVFAQSTPTPTPSYGYLSLDHSVRNVTRSTEGTSVTAYSGDRLQFIARITTGNQKVYNAQIRDFLPNYVVYVSGTTTVNNVSYVDGITTSGLNLGTLQANRTYTVRLQATYNYTYGGSMSSTNTVTASADNVGTQTRNTFVNNGSYATPTYTPIPTGNPYVSLTAKQYGSNVTLGQVGEYTSVKARGGDTLDIRVHVRNTSILQANNVYITDLLPSGLNYVSGSTSLNGVVIADGITTAGINIGSLYANQESVVRFSVRVDGTTVPAWGQVVVTNTAQVRGDGISTISTSLPITLGQNVSLASIGQVQTGPVDSILLALIVSALATGVYAMYTRTNIFGRRYALAQVNSHAGKALDFSR